MTIIILLSLFFIIVAFFIGHNIRKYKTDREQYISQLRVGDNCRFYQDHYLINTMIKGIRKADRLVITKKGVVSFDKLIM